MPVKDTLPESDRPWSIERNGINQIPDGDRHGSAMELFWVWFAANIGILGVVYGGILAEARLNLWQSVLVAFTGAAGSFLLVGVLSIPGKWAGVPQLMLSRLTFGKRGNLGPALLSWINLLGWEIISVATATYAFLGLLSLAGLPSNRGTTILSLTCIAALTVILGLLGHATVVWVQRAATWVFGALTLVIVVMLVTRTDWSAVLHAPPASWASEVLPTLSIIFAGTGISWVTTGADYTRYLPRRISGRNIVLATTAGATVPLFVLIMVGVLLASHVKALASSPNPVATIGTALPAFMAVPYLITAIGGLVAAADLAMYSSGLNILVLGLRAARHKTVLIDGIVMIGGAIFILLVNGNLVGSLVSFLQVLAAGLAAWAGVCLLDTLKQGIGEWTVLGPMTLSQGSRSRDGVRWDAALTWILGLGLGLACTTTPWFSGPLARGVFAASDLGYLLGLVVSAGSYGILTWFRVWQRDAGTVTETVR